MSTRKNLRLVVIGIAVALAGGLAARLWALRPVPDVEEQSRAYVHLALELGRRSPAEVDFYFGPAELHPHATTAILTSEQLQTQIRSLLQAVEDAQVRQPLVRRERLMGKLIHLQRLVGLIDGKQEQGFGDQAKRLYGIRADFNRKDTASVLLQLEQLLPGAGSLFDRMQAWRSRWIIASERRQSVFERALQECRQLTKMHWPLDDAESVEIRWTRKTAAAWHRYQGESHSVLQINPDAIAYFPSVLTLACHEAYPGHHAQYLLLDAAAGSAGIPIEDTVVLLRSRQSVLLEGAANLGVELAFGEEQRIAFERDVLIPLAGLPVELAAKQRQISKLESQLATNILPILRDFHDKAISRDEAVRQLQGMALLPDAGALLDYTRDFGAYVMGYTAVEGSLRTVLQHESSQHGTDVWQQLRTIVERPADAHIPSLTVDSTE